MRKTITKQPNMSKLIYKLVFQLALIGLAQSVCQLKCLHQQNISRRTKYHTFYCHWVGTGGQTLLPGCVTLDRAVMSNITTDYHRCHNLKNCFRRKNCTDMSEISFSGIGLERLESDFLAEFPGLEKLNCFNNSISFVGVGAFKNSRLRYINLKGNRISEFSTHFENLTKMNALDLRLNNLSRLSPSMFRGMKRLGKLYLWGNSLKTMDFLYDLPKLHELSIQFDDSFSSSLQDFPHFARMTRLEVTFDSWANVTIFNGTHRRLIDLRMNGVSALDEAFFDQTPALQFLVVNNAKLGNVTKRLLSRLENLASLNINNTGIEFVEKGAFAQCRRLHQLKMGGNRLRAIDRATFEGLHQLIYVDLSFNDLTELGPDAFSSLSQVKMMNLGFNRLNFIDPSAFVKTIEIQHIDLEANNLTELNLPRLSSLRTLILDNNSFVILDTKLMKNLTSLERISILHNPLKRIPAPSFIFAQIVDISFGCCSARYEENERLQCHDTSIRVDKNALKLSNFFQGNRMMRRVRILGCVDDFHADHLVIETNEFILRWNSWRTSLGNLDLKNVGDNAIFDIRNNDIYRINNRQFPNMKAKLLDLSHNRIREINPNAFADSSIEHIRLNGNELKTLSIILNLESPAIFQSIELQNMSLESFSLTAKDGACKQYLSLDLSHNQIENMNSIQLQGFKHFSTINVSNNRVKTFNSDASLFDIESIDNFDISNNSLKVLPEEILDMKHTFIKADGNEWDCSKCINVYLFAHAKKYMDIQGMTCYNNVPFSLNATLNQCLIEEIYIPYPIVSIVFLTILMKVIHSINILRLMRKYNAYQKLCLNSLSARKKFVGKSKLQQKLNHNNILVLYGFATELNLKTFFLSGYLFTETPYSSLQEALNMFNDKQIILDREDLCKQLLKAIDYLHSSSPPVYHLGLCFESLHLAGKASDWTLKLSNFSTAQVPGSFDQCYALRDLHDAADLISLMMQPSTIEFKVLASALRHGLFAAKALTSPAFVPISTRISMIQQMSETLKRWNKLTPNAQARIPGFQMVEVNSSLVIGGRGSWNKLFAREIMEEFGFNHKGYRTTKFIDLIRFVRNIIAHAQDHPDLMLSALGASTPTDDQFYSFFSNLFPYFYLHAMRIHEKIENTSGFDDDIYFCEYGEHENSANVAGLADGSVLRLDDESHVHVTFSYFDPDAMYSVSIAKTLSFHEGEPRSRVDGSDVVKEIMADVNTIWPQTIDEGLDGIIAKNHLGDNIFVKGATKQNAGVLEGSTVEISKMQCLVHSPSVPRGSGFKFIWDYHSKSNVEALKGKVILRLREVGHGAVRKEQISVYRNGKKLAASDNILKLDFSGCPFIVECGS